LFFDIIKTSLIMKNMKFAVLALAVVFAVSSAFTTKLTSFYWFNPDNQSIGGSTYHFSEPTGTGSIAEYLATVDNTKTYDTNASGGTPYANGYNADNTSGSIQVTVYGH
jgi:hypothetical protein